MRLGKWKPAHIRTATLAAAAVIAACFAVRLALAPGLERRRAADQRDALLDSIRHSDGVIALDEHLAANAVDYYDGGAEAPPEEAVFLASPSDAAVSSDAIDAGIINGIGILTIDSIGLELPVVDGVSDAQLKIALGHVPQTAAVGDTGNAVIAGHRSYTHGEHFNRLGEIENGDIIRYQSIDGTAMVFVVDETLEVPPGDQTAFVQPEDNAMLTLYTCTPIRTATHRLLIRASRIS